MGSIPIQRKTIPRTQIRIGAHTICESTGPLLKIMPAFPAKNYTLASSVTMGYHIRQISESKEAFLTSVFWISGLRIVTIHTIYLLSTLLLKSSIENYIELLDICIIPGTLDPQQCFVKLLVARQLEKSLLPIEEISLILLAVLSAMLSELRLLVWCQEGFGTCHCKSLELRVGVKLHYKRVVVVLK